MLRETHFEVITEIEDNEAMSPQPLTTKPLSRLEIKHLDSNGFAACNKPISHSKEIDELCLLFSKMIEDRAGYSEGALFDLTGTESSGKIRFPSLHDPSNYAPYIKKASCGKPPP